MRVKSYTIERYSNPEDRVYNMTHSHCITCARSVGEMTHGWEEGMLELPYIVKPHYDILGGKNES